MSDRSSSGTAPVNGAPGSAPRADLRSRRRTVVLEQRDEEPLFALEMSPHERLQAEQGGSGSRDLCRQPGCRAADRGRRADAWPSRGSADGRSAPRGSPTASRSGHRSPGTTTPPPRRCAVRGCCRASRGPRAGGADNSGVGSLADFACHVVDPVDPARQVTVFVFCEGPHRWVSVSGRTSSVRSSSRSWCQRSTATRVIPVRPAPPEPLVISARVGRVGRPAGRPQVTSTGRRPRIPELTSPAPRRQCQERGTEPRADR